MIIRDQELADVIEVSLVRRQSRFSPGGVPQQDVMDLIGELRNRTGPNGNPLTIGQFNRIIPSAAMPHPDASETGEPSLP